MALNLTTATDIQDFIRGVTLLGTGGGGSPALGAARMMEMLEKNGAIELVDPEKIGDDEMTCCVFGMGSIAPNEPVPGAYGQNIRVTKDPNLRALQELEKLTGCRISAVVAFEPGGLNTTIALHAGTMLGCKLVDGDYSGRAVPELGQTMPVIAEKTVTPTAICDDWGNVIHVKQAASSQALEALGKQISMVTKAPDRFAICAHAGMLLSGREMKKYILPHTLSRAFVLGSVIRTANERGENAAQAAAALLGGRILFTGMVERLEYTSGGYMTGDAYLAGSGDHKGQTLRVWFKNENHIAWKDGAVVATSPDMIAIVRQKDAEPITNSDLAVGQEVAVLGVPHPAYRTAPALGHLEPRHFGFDFDYVELEKLW